VDDYIKIKIVYLEVSKVNKRLFCELLVLLCFQKYLRMTIPEIFDNFNNLKVLIIGDVMLDAYTWGKVERISPEAQCP
jgi:hypothetical protein